MQRWWTYLKERSPLFILLILSTGPLVSGFFLSQVHGNCEASGSQSCIRNSPRAELTFLAILSSMTFMILARMMDELKDFAKDKIANPLRPLPRGLISPSEMSRAVVLVFGILLAFSGLILFWGSALSSILLGFSVLYLWLMYKEFYVASRLAEFPIIYALSHQFVGVPLYLFGVTLYVGSNVAASLTYEFARKLRPDAHTAAATYRQIYGLKKAAALTLFFQITALLFSVQALSGGFQGAAILLALQLCVIVVLCVVTAKDSHHKAAEGLAALGVLASAWMGLFVFFKF
jgi:4-hydroxybenzoate polyprenyltransferase